MVPWESTTVLQKRFHLDGYTSCRGPIRFRPTRKVWVTFDVVIMDTSRTLKGSTLLRTTDCLFSVLLPYSERFFPFSIVCFKRLERRREVRDAVFFLGNIYLRHASPQWQTCQPPKRAQNCEILNLEAGKAVRNGSKVVRCSKFASGRTFSGIMGIGSHLRR